MYSCYRRPPAARMGCTEAGLRRRSPPALLAALLLAPSAAALDNGLGRTPPLGWSGFNFFAFELNETIMLETADAMISTGLAKLGFEYVNLDAGWLTSARDPNTSAVIPVEYKWPSGIRSMADKIHAKGLKFGVCELPLSILPQRVPRPQATPAPVPHRVGRGVSLMGWGGRYS